jgi:predicted ester cyclase
MSTTADVALAVSRSILNGEWKTLDRLLAPGFTYHGDSATYSRSEYIGFMQGLKQAMTDMTMDFTHVVSEGNLVSIRFVTRATNTGKFMGAPATRKRVEITGCFIRKVENDQVVEEWQSTDLLGLMTQMGFGTLFGYSIAAGLLKKKPAIPAPVI